MQGSGLKQSSVGKAHASHMWSLKVHDIIASGSSNIWHCMCDISDTVVPYTEKKKIKNPLSFICKTIMPWEYDNCAPYFQNYFSNTSIKNCHKWLAFLFCIQEISRFISSSMIGYPVWGFPYFLHEICRTVYALIWIWMPLRCDTVNTH